jgi:hypothetical protein
LQLREHAARVEHEVAQQVELGRRQLDRRLAAEHLVALLVEDEVGEAEDAARRRAARPAQDRLRARHDFRQAERLRDVVVAARLQRLHLVLQSVLRRQEEHGDVEAAGAQPPADFDAVHVRQHHVEHDEVGLELRDGRERLASGARLLDVVALVAERRRDGVDDRRLVVDDEDPLLRCLRVRVHASDRATRFCEEP